MKISYNWLKEFIDINLPIESFTNKLTFAGIEVESIEQIGQNWGKIITVKIETTENIKENLKVCTVFDGKKRFQVVCSAPNCRSDMFSAFAGIGTKIGSQTIKKVKICGVESFGMLCSEKELGISNDHSGIIELPKTSSIGKTLSEQGYKSDFIIDVEITPNRADLLGMVGLARDISAILGKKFSPMKPKINSTCASGKIEDYLSLENHSFDDCHRFTARLIKGVKIGESPKWMKKRLNSLGINSVNNIVDITNYVLLEFGHPLHAFDYDKIEGKKIIIRRAKSKEKITALDQKLYSLSKNDIVVADSNKAISIAGIIGGENSAISDETVNIVLEVACFKAPMIHRTSQNHKIFTDASYRFERGMSKISPILVSERATQLILEIAGGKLVGGILDSFDKSISVETVFLRPKRVRKVLNINVSDSEIKEYMDRLGLSIKNSNEKGFEFLIPHFRADLRTEADLIEEVIRLFGYNNVPSSFIMQPIGDKHLFNAKRSIANFLVQKGFFETINMSFSDPELEEKLLLQNGIGDCVKIANPLGKESSSMRRSLLPSLLNNLLYNQNVGQSDINLFEISKIYKQKQNGFANEPYYLCVISCGYAEKLFWQNKRRFWDFFDIKAIAEMVLNTLEISNFNFRESERTSFEQGARLDIEIRDKYVGTFGQLSKRVVDNFRISAPVFCLELNISKALSLGKKTKKVFTPISKFPAIIRDISCFASFTQSAQEIQKFIKSVSPNLIKKVVLFDEYKKVNQNHNVRSLSFNITFLSFKETLTDNKINAIIQKIEMNLIKKFDVKIRKL